MVVTDKGVVTPGEYDALRRVLEECCADEVHHRNEAAALFVHGSTEEVESRVPVPANGVMRLWAAVVTLGSKAAVVVAKRI